MTIRKILALPLLTVSLVWGVSAFAQSAFVAPPSITEPLLVPTFEIDQVKLVPIATGLANPWAMAFRDNGDILITERYTGKLRVIRDGKLLERDIPGVPEVYSAVFRAGLMAVCGASRRRSDRLHDLYQSNHARGGAESGSEPGSWPIGRRQSGKRGRNFRCEGRG